MWGTHKKVDDDLQAVYVGAYIFFIVWWSHINH